jgi:hypothetical protein
VGVVGAYFGSSLALHFLWEQAQMSSFELPVLSRAEAVWMCLRATVTGDLAFMTVLYCAAAIIHRDWWWVAEPTAYRHPATWVIPTVLGVLLAVSFELWAVYCVARWEYGSMPLVPVLRVGLWPVLQMMLVPLATVAICHWCAARHTRNRRVE